MTFHYRYRKQIIIVSIIIILIGVITYFSVNTYLSSKKKNVKKTTVVEKKNITNKENTQEDIKEDNEFLYPVLKQLKTLVFEYHERCFETKKEMNAYSFSDIEHFAIDLLFKNSEEGVIRTDIAKEYENNFYEILVDEYQDTNAAQDKLFEMLSNGKNRFMGKHTV